MTNSRLFSFVGSSGGVWKIVSTNVLIGEGLPSADFLSVVSGNVTEPLKGWVLKGVTSNERYVNQVEKKELVSRQEGLGRGGDLRRSYSYSQERYLVGDDSGRETRGFRGKITSY